MITIKITNAREIIEGERNWLIAKLAPYFIDVQIKVEKEIAREIQKSFADRNIQSVISVVKDDSFSLKN